MEEIGLSPRSWGFPLVVALVVPVSLLAVLSYSLNFVYPLPGLLLFIAGGVVIFLCTALLRAV